MATLVLTAVGNAIAGPIGAAVGSIVGNYIDQTVLFAPKPRHGPRLGDLAAQTSAYGTAIPRIFGRMRVAGTVIWATDLVETRSTSGGGKGRAKTVAYSYSASFAVALSARPIRSVGRIWADGKLLRGGAGDFKTATDFRVHGGGQDQPPDPLIASAEGTDQSSAFRGVAYAVFENLKLEDFGNRIPSLTFEVEADAEPVPIGAVAAELSDFAIEPEATPALTGYAAGGDSIRSAIEALSDVVPLSLADRDGALRLTFEPAAPIGLAAAEEIGRRETIRRAAGSVPAEVAIAYYELERDFQAGLQRATSGGTANAGSADRRALPASLSAAGAKALAEFRLASLIAGRTSARLELGWRRLGLRPGDAVRPEGESGAWRVRRWTLRPMAVALEVERLPGGPFPDSAPAAPGRSLREPDLPHGPTLLRLLDLPLAHNGTGAPTLLVAAAGTEAGWRRADLLASYDGGTGWQEAGATAAPAVMGVALAALAPGGSTLIDTVGAVEVELANGAMWLENASDDALVDGANLALIGDELIQIGTAEWLGERRFRLTRLLRGRRGTEWAAAGYQAGEDFILIEPGALAPLEAPPGAIGSQAQLSASGVGDVEAVTAILTISGESLRPPSPAHLRAERLESGDISIRWIRRSRQGWFWASGHDTPVAEEKEEYALTIAGAGFSRLVPVSAPEHVYSAAEQAADGAGGTILLSVVQAGTYAVSRPTTATYSWEGPIP